MTQVKSILLDVQLVPITDEDEWPSLPVYHGPPPSRLHDDQWCDCEEEYENQILVPKGHSLISLCPKCGCVTVD
ncbi:MAG TPA: hypothetical protein VEL76_32600 [Gemmataceae bacterium]|nr:hypothetical protein [Gemmataceae bacterium]